MKAIITNEVIYTPKSDLLEPGKFVQRMFKDLVLCRELAWRMFLRDFTAHYRQSFLGYVWAFVPPLATTVTFVFLRSQGLFTTGETAIPYPAYVIIGMLFWQLFVDAIQSPLRSVSAAKSVISKTQIPPEAIVLAGLGEVVVNFLIRLILLVIVFAWYGMTPPASSLLALFAVVGLLVLGFTLGVLITPLGILYTDVMQALSVITTFWLFLTPVIYPVRDTGLAATLARWNPVSPLLIAGRDWLTVGHTTHLVEFVLLSLGATIMLFFGWIAYRIAMPHLVSRIGN